MRHVWILAFISASLGCETQLPVGDTPCEVAAHCDDGEACVRGRCTAIEGDAGTWGSGTSNGVACTLSTEWVACGQDAYCAEGVCAPVPACDGTSDCPSGLRCDEDTRRCTRAEAGCLGADCQCGQDVDCDDGRYCNGLERCDEATGACSPGASPCASPEICDERTRACVACLEDNQCPGANEVCAQNVCICVPDCSGRSCGDDGCGGSCGTCPGGARCGDDGTCGCTPDCQGRSCGSDGCGGSCGTCGASETCQPDGSCACVPSCVGRTCGDDGCGGSCGSCPEALQSCSDAGDCLYTGPVCDAFVDAITLSGFGSATGALSATADQVFAWDARPTRILDNFLLGNITSGQTTQVTLTGDFDTYLYIYDVDNGACTLVSQNDDLSSTDSNSSLVFSVGGGTYQVVVTSFPEATTGAYTLQTQTDLCGAAVVDAETYDACFPLSGDCTRNRCLAYGSSPEFCCVTASCRDGYSTGGQVTIQQSAPVCMP